MQRFFNERNIIDARRRSILLSLLAVNDRIQKLFYYDQFANVFCIVVTRLFLLELQIILLHREHI